MTISDPKDHPDTTASVVDWLADDDLVDFSTVLDPSLQVQADQAQT